MRASDVKRVLRPLALAGRIVAVLEWAAVLEELRGLNGVDGLAFRGPRGEKLGPTAVGNALMKADINATGHGFRSSFKD